jgi:hypothetical protein
VLDGLLLLQIGLLVLGGPHGVWFSTVQWTPRQIEAENSVFSRTPLTVLAAPLLAAAGNAFRGRWARRTALCCVIGLQVAVFVINVRAPVWGVDTS